MVTGTDGGEVFGFDRTFLLETHGLITNGHIAVREPPDSLDIAES
jgi:hypothetical protein